MNQHTEPEPTTDRELLEMAAKAGGYSLSDVSDMIWSDAAVEYIPWDPLTDDGDAMRLAVQLQIDVKHYDHYVVAWFEGGFIGTGKISYGDDACAATRLAIVRAAAEIGKQIKGGQHGTE